MPRPVLEFDAKKFGRAVRRFRKSRALSQEAVQDQTGIPFHMVGRVENASRLSARGVLCLAAWADINLIEYVKINRKDMR